MLLNLGKAALMLNKSDAYVNKLRRSQAGLLYPKKK